MFVIVLTYIKPPGEVDRLIGAHNAYLERNYQNSRFIASGRRVPRTGGVILARAASAAEIGGVDQPHTFHYLPDIARGLLVLARRPEADGQVWHLPAAEPLTAQQFFDLIAQAAGQPTPVKASIAGPALLAAAGLFSPMARELRETTYQFRAPFVIDSAKFHAAFGRLDPTPHRDAVRQTIDWYRSRGQPDQPRQ
jgi:nucleoside-diphosphate-sugar epimerase